MAMKFGRMVDLGGYSRSSPHLVNLWPRGYPPRPKSGKSKMHWTVVSQVDKLAGQSRGPCDKLAPLAVTAIGMWGVRQSGQLAYLFFNSVIFNFNSSTLLSACIIKIGEICKF